MPRPPATLAIIALALLALVGAGCGGAGAPVTTTGGGGTAGPAEVRVWFAAPGGERLVAETREAPAGAAPLAAAMAALADGPRRRDLVPALPPGTRVLATSLGEGTATVDLSGAFAAGYAAGAAGELAQIAPLVVTATAVPGAERVLVLVDGAAPDVPGAQFDLSAPLRRADLPAGMRG